MRNIRIYSYNADYIEYVLNLIHLSIYYLLEVFNFLIKKKKRGETRKKLDHNSQAQID